MLITYDTYSKTVPKVCNILQNRKLKINLLLIIFDIKYIGLIIKILESQKKSWKKLAAKQKKPNLQSQIIINMESALIIKKAEMRKKKIPLAWQTVLAAILAIIIGRAWPQAASYMGSFGDIFARMLSLMAIPFVLVGICSAITNKSDYGFAGRIILKNLSGFVGMETLAVGTALLVSNIVFYNTGIELPSSYGPISESPREFGDFLLKMVPGDISSIFTQSNLPGVVVMACIFGYFTHQCADRSRIFLTNLFSAGNDVMQRVCDLVASICPIGVFCIFCQTASDSTILDSLPKVSPLITAASIALGIHALISIPLILKVSSGVRPFRLLKMFSNSLYTSISFSSSTLAMPLAVNRMKSDAGISAHVSDFSMPVISVLNFNGTSIFLATAAMYVAQAYGINLSIMEQVVLMLAVSCITIGTVDFPLRLSLIMYPVMEYLGIPLEGMGAIIICELLFGMLCPMVDLWANIAVTVNIAEGEGDKIKTETEAGI